MRRIAVLDAPSNLGLRPPTGNSVPGCAKGPGAIRDHGLLSRLEARDAGCLTPPRYDLGDWRPGDGVAHAAAISMYSVRLADRIGAMLDLGEFPLVLGGDCSVVIGAGLAMRRRSSSVGGRVGLIYVDGHSDFRHPGNASYVGAAAGEGLALVTGRGQPELAAIEHRRPYFRDSDVALVGIRAHDDYRLDLEAAGIQSMTVPRLRVEGAARTAQWARSQIAECVGYWVHVDVDVLDPAVMPAVDAPDPGGIAYAEFELLLNGLVSDSGCLGMEITVFDPDYDLDGVHARAVTDSIVAGLRPLVVSQPARFPDPDSSRFRTPRPGSSGRPAVPAARRPSASVQGASVLGPRADPSDEPSIDRPDDSSGHFGPDEDETTPGQAGAELPLLAQLPSMAASSGPEAESPARP